MRKGPLAPGLLPLPWVLGAPRASVLLAPLLSLHCSCKGHGLHRSEGPGHAAGGGWGQTLGFLWGHPWGQGGPWLGHRSREMDLGALWLGPGSRWVVRVAAAPAEEGLWAARVPRAAHS